MSSPAHSSPAVDDHLDLAHVARRVGRLAEADAAWLVAAGICALGSVAGFVLALWGAFDRVPPAARAVDLGLAEQGANVLLPAGGTGGPAFGTLVMRRAGVPADHAAERHVALFLATSAVSIGALTVFGVLAFALGEVSAAKGLVPAAIGAVAIGVPLLWARRPAPPRAEQGAKVVVLLRRLRRFLHAGVRTTIERLRHGDRLLGLGAVLYYAFDVAALACAFQALGGGAPALPVFLLAYTIGHAGAFLPTPGGVGGTDGGLIGAFVLYGAPLDLATAAVLGYRVFQLGLPVLLGAVGLLRVARTLHDVDRDLVAARFAEKDCSGAFSADEQVVERRKDRVDEPVAG